MLTRAHSYAMSGQPVKKKLKRAVQVDVFGHDERNIVRGPQLLSKR